MSYLSTLFIVAFLTIIFAYFGTLLLEATGLNGDFAPFMWIFYGLIVLVVVIVFFKKFFRGAPTMG